MVSALEERVEALEKLVTVMLLSQVNADQAIDELSLICAMLAQTVTGKSL